MKKILFAFTLLLTLPLSAHAVTLRFVPEKSISGVGQEVRVQVVLSTDASEVNAIEGSVVLPPSLSLVRIEDGNSLVTLWLKRPTAEGQAIPFSGVTPGGYAGQNGRVFAFVVKVVREGNSALTFSNVQLLKNDGEGTVIGTDGVPLSLSVRGKAEDVSPVLVDDVRPETFVPTIGKDESLFDGSWFVAFTTQDKGVGIDHYTVQESKSRIGLWFSQKVNADSPYILKDQSGKSFVRVTAYDKEGNTRSATAVPAVPAPWYVRGENIFALLLCVALILIGAFFYRKNLK